MDMRKLGNKIQALREGKKMNQEQLANAIGCSQPALSNYEKGKRRIYLAQLEKLAEIFEKPINYFLDENEPENAPVVQQKNNDQKICLSRILENLYFLNPDALRDTDAFIQYLLWKQQKGGIDSGSGA
jgi:transcriptional regulator with XRE-family HTH domain